MENTNENNRAPCSLHGITDDIIKEIRSSLTEIKNALVGSMSGNRGLLDRVRELETIAETLLKAKIEHDARVRKFLIKVASWAFGGSGIITILINIFSGR